jgi:hypothetical protein
VRRGGRCGYRFAVERWLVFHEFPAAGGWDVIADIDSVERGDAVVRDQDGHAVDSVTPPVRDA